AWEDLPAQFSAVSLLSNDSDADGGVLTVTGVGQADHGTVQLKNGMITYLSAPNYFGTDSFSYTISDGQGGTSVARVIMQVHSINDDPVAVADYFEINEDSGPVSLLILANDNGANPDPGEVVTIAAISQPVHGTIAVLSGSGVLQYTPTRDFVGTEILMYTIHDPSGWTASSQVTIVVRNVNDAPVANADAKSVAENGTLEFSASSLLANDSDVDGDLLTVKAVGAAEHGTVTLKDGVITYTPAKDFHGSDRFSYSVSDPAGATSTGYVNVTVTEVVQDPVMGDDFRSGTEDTALTLTASELLGNDRDPNGYPLSIVGASANSQTRGTVQWTGSQVIFTPAANFNGTTSFTYTVSNGHGGTGTGTVTVQVQAVNDAPVLSPVDGPLAIDEGQLVSHTMTASDVDSSTLSYSLVNGPWGATIDPATGVFSWTPGYDQAGTYSFSIRVTDNGSPSLSDTKPVTIVVKDVPSVEPVLQVRSVTLTPSGVDVQFNLPIDTSELNLYDGLGRKGRAADLKVVGASTGPVSGTAVWDAASNTLHFVKTGGSLAADTYSVTLFSRDDGFAGLDGDNDGQAGGDYVGSFTMAASSTRTLSLPDIARGPQQSFNLPIRMDNAAGVQSVRFELQYDPALLTIDETVLAAGLPAGWNVSTQESAPGRLRITLSGTTPLAAGAMALLQLKASVPADAPYGSAGTLRLAGVKVNDGDARGDTAVQAVAYLGDASGNKSYSGLDAALIANVAIRAVRGFEAYPLIDPVIIGDINSNGSIGGLDASYVAQKSIGLPRTEIPDLPSIAPAAPLAFKVTAAAANAFAQTPIQNRLPAESVLYEQPAASSQSQVFGVRSIDAA
ncbi:MAG TPA: Ig-like domain-containing protein, partial [Tepidisphaeraceae bacterium]|nr:Ig-like domain-containing protein [Tepidisphaeraceae bacterium]